MDLVITLSNKIYLKLIEDKDLKTIDEITSKYENEEDLINSKEFKYNIEEFYKKYKNYIDKMTFTGKNPGKVKIATHDNNMYDINVLYRKNKNKMNTRRLIGSIEKSLKSYIDINILLELSKRCSFFLDSDYNYRTKGLRRIKNILYTAGNINDNVIKNYNKLVNIIKDELLKGYNKETKEVTEKTYIYTRHIDSYLERVGVETIKPLKRLKVNEEKMKTIKKPKINKHLPKELIGQGTSYFLDFIAEEYNKNSVEFSEEEYIMDIDDFSFEEKDDESTWFK